MLENGTIMAQNALNENQACPFCGGKLVNYSRGIIGAPIVFLKCGNLDCGAVVSFDNDLCHMLPEKAIDFWNNRADLRPHGKWQLYEDEDTNAWECSVCNAVFQLMDGTPEENHMHYCHNCGAKMTMETCYNKKGKNNNGSEVVNKE